MSLSKVLALSSQPCKHSTGCPSEGPQALAATWPQGTGNFNSENMPKIVFTNDVPGEARARSRSQGSC